MSELRLHIVLARLLAERHISMRALGRATDIPESTLSGYLNGAEPSKAVHVRAITRFFGVSMEYLLFEENPITATQLVGDWGRLSIRQLPDGTLNFVIKP